MLNFETGKLHEVANHRRPNLRREYTLLVVILLATSVPYLIAFAYRPFATFCVVMFMAYFQVLMAFATSTNTDTAHAIRFLLSGSNPIGMTGASSLMFGAVDSVLDWREDSGDRRKNKAKFWALTIYKLAMTPIGVLLMVLEFLWDAIAMRRPGVIRHKWNELFSLARFHDLVCPEKSNDIFYADMAHARHQSDPMLYQWNRLRSMVFELQHYRLDAEQGIGVPETNIFLQSEVAAYQTLKRLQVEHIEQKLADHYEVNLDEFPFPENVAKRLVGNARPIEHFLRIRDELLPSVKPFSEFDAAVSEFLKEREQGRYRTWALLRLMDEDPDSSGYVSDTARWEGCPIVRTESGRVRLCEDARNRLQQIINRYCVNATDEEVAALNRSQLPAFFFFEGRAYRERS